MAILFYFSDFFKKREKPTAALVPIPAITENENNLNQMEAESSKPTDPGVSEAVSSAVSVKSTTDLLP